MDSTVAKIGRSMKKLDSMGWDPGTVLGRANSATATVGNDYLADGLSGRMRDGVIRRGGLRDRLDGIIQPR